MPPETTQLFEANGVATWAVDEERGELAEPPQTGRGHQCPAFCPSPMCLEVSFLLK